MIISSPFIIPAFCVAISSKEFPNRLRFRFDDEYAFDYNDGPRAASKKDVRNAIIKENSR